MKTLNMCLLLAFFALGIHADDIDRKTFSLSLPIKWSEDTKNDMYNPDSFVFFDGPESFLFAVIIGQKSAGASVDALVNKFKDGYLKKFKDPAITVLRQWSNCEGKGFKIDGKIMGILNARVTIFGFEKDDNICVIEEYAALDDYKKYVNDFDKLRRTFKLK